MQLPQLLFLLYISIAILFFINIQIPVFLFLVVGMVGTMIQISKVGDVDGNVKGPLWYSSI